VEQELTIAVYKVRKKFSYGFESHLDLIGEQEHISFKVSRWLLNDKFTVQSSEKTHQELGQIITKLKE